MSEPRIRMAVPEDAGAVAAVYAPYVADTVISFEAEPPGADEVARRMAATMEQYPWLVVEDDGAVLGYAYAGEHSGRAAYRWGVDVSVYLAADARRQGLGRRLYEALFEILRAQGYVRAYAGISLPNAGSVGLHEALGFRPVGVYEGAGYKFGAWVDVGWWQLTLADPPADPPPPRPWREVRVSSPGGRRAP